MTTLRRSVALTTATVLAAGLTQLVPTTASVGTVALPLAPTSSADEVDRTLGNGLGRLLDEITLLNNRFHREILEASGNGRLVQLVATVVAVPIVWRTFSHYSPAAMRRSLAHHHELVDALAAQDPAWAESVMRSHVRAARSTLAAHDPDPSPDAGT